MRSIITSVGGVALAALALGCGSDAPSCEQVVDHMAKLGEDKAELGAAKRAEGLAWCKEKMSAAVRRCVMAAASGPEIFHCLTTDPAEEKARAGKRSEAEIQLGLIDRSLKRYHAEHAAFPATAAPLTPATPCCAGPHGKCPVDLAPWAAEPWTSLDFEQADPHLYRYEYVVIDAATKVVVRAVGDLDCDEVTSAYELQVSVRDGNVYSNIQYPDVVD